MLFKGEIRKFNQVLLHRIRFLEVVNLKGIIHFGPWVELGLLAMVSPYLSLDQIIVKSQLLARLEI